MTSISDINWAAGFLEGEGTFISILCGKKNNEGKRTSRSHRVCAGQNQLWPLLKLQRMFGGGVYKAYKESTDLFRVWYVHGSRARGIMMTLYSLLSPGRKLRVNKTLSQWNRRKLVCKRGHPFSKENTIIGKKPSGKYQRICRICRDRAGHEAYLRKKSLMVKGIEVAKKSVGRPRNILMMKDI